MLVVFLFQQLINNGEKHSLALVDLFSALLTPLIAIIALYIAIQQYLINKRRLKHETYERKLEVYKVVKQYLLEIQRDAKTSYARCSEFYTDASEVSFLFSKSIQKIIDEIYSKSIEIVTLEEQLYPRGDSNGLPVGEKRSRVSEENTILVKWHSNKLKEIREQFKKEMAIK